jgi:hypothetical protein
LGEIESSLMDSFASFRSRIRGPQHHSSFLARSLTTASARNQEVLRDPRGARDRVWRGALCGVKCRSELHRGSRACAYKADRPLGFK